MAGCITTKAQPIDAITVKLFQCYYRYLYGEYMLIEPLNSMNKPIATINQLFAQWCGISQDKVSEELIKKRKTFGKKMWMILKLQKAIQRICQTLYLKKIISLKLKRW